MTEQESVPEPPLVRVWWQPREDPLGLGQIAIYRGPRRMEIWETSTEVWSARIGLIFRFDMQTRQQIVDLVDHFLEGDS